MRAITDILAALTEVLALVKLADNDFDQFDKLAAHVRRHRGTMAGASTTTGIPVTSQILTIVACGHIFNWPKGGAEAALSLPDAAQFDVTVALDQSPTRTLVMLAVNTLRILAWIHIGDETKEPEAGKALLSLCKCVLNLPGQNFELVVKLALHSRDILDRAEDPQADVAQLIAYRLLVLPNRLPFLPDLPPTKFPPPIPPSLEENEILNLCLEFIDQGVLAQPLDLCVEAAQMRNDRETVIKNRALVEINGRMREVNFELAFGAGLLDWAFSEDPGHGAQFDANTKLRGMLSILCEHRQLLEGFQDDDLGYVYQMIYLGKESNRSNFLGLAMKTECFSDYVRCIVGLKTEDVLSNNVRDHVTAARSVHLLDYIRQHVMA